MKRKNICLTLCTLAKEVTDFGAVRATKDFALLK
jgi:hypothetical protein